MKASLFQIGDKVSWLGVNGEVTKIDETSIYGVRVDFEGGETHFFTETGLYFQEQTEGALKLEQRARRSMKLKIKRWLVIGPLGQEIICKVKPNIETNDPVVEMSGVFEAVNE